MLEEEIVVADCFDYMERLVQLSTARKACCWSSMVSSKLLVVVRGSIMGCWMLSGGY